MAKLTMLKPRVQMLKADRVPTVQLGSWRTRDMGGTARGYGYRWQKARKRFLAAHPLCVMCKAESRVTAATIVDHKIPHRGDQTLFWDESNWQPLCKPHHDGEKKRQETRSKA